MLKLQCFHWVKNLLCSDTFSQLGSGSQEQEHFPGHWLQLDQLVRAVPKDFPRAVPQNLLLCQPLASLPFLKLATARFG